MGNEPLDEEIPIEIDDFNTEVQEAFGIYSRLKDEWEGMSGSYMGKNYSGILDIFKIMSVPEEDWKTMFDLIGIIDYYRSEHIRKTREQQKSNRKNPA